MRTRTHYETHYASDLYEGYSPEQVRAREERVKAVNTWRALQGRPALTFLHPWKNPEEWTPDPETAWGGEKVTAFSYKIDGQPSAPSSRATLCRPLPPKVMAQWRETDPRPANPVFYDGRPQPYIRPFTPKPRTRKGA